MTTHTPRVAPSRTARILVVDDERSMRELLEIALKREGYEVLVADGGRSAVDVLKREAVDLLVSDVKMPDMNGVEVLKAAKQIDREIVGIMITAYASTDSAVKALNMGAHDYLSKPFNVDELKKVVRNAIEHRQLREENAALKRTLRTSSSFSNIIGQSDPMTEVFHLVDRVAPTNSTVLITGESGTGKELVARAIHVNSLRQNRPFVAVNCGALPETLLESELFGHMRGAFTGADSNKKGLVEVADRGTIFLDEIGEMSLLMQVKLLRVLQERTFRRVGGTSEVNADIRVIAATNRDLGSLVSSGQFREDLFYRINVISVHLPPLRERVEDIPLLAETFVQKFAKQMVKPVQGLSSGAQWALRAYEWPGNVRELENVLERAVALEPTETIQADSLQLQAAHASVARDQTPPDGADGHGPEIPDSGFDLEQHVKQIERDYIAQALERAGGVKMKAADLLGMSFRSFRYYVKKYNLG